jgi:hypothetical protein
MTQTELLERLDQFAATWERLADEHRALITNDRAGLIASVSANVHAKHTAALRSLLAEAGVVVCPNCRGHKRVALSREPCSTAEIDCRKCEGRGFIIAEAKPAEPAKPLILSEPHRVDIHGNPAFSVGDEESGVEVESDDYSTADPPLPLSRAIPREEIAKATIDEVRERVAKVEPGAGEIER